MTKTRSPVGSGFLMPVQFLKGVGPVRAEALARIGITDLLDLLFYVPRRYLDRSGIVSISDLRHGGASVPPTPITPAGDEDLPVARKDVTVIGEVRSFKVLGVGRKSRFVMVLSDGTGSLQCVWFGGVQYWRRAFRVGESLAVSGQPAWYGGVLQFVHPDFDRLSAGGEEQDLNWKGMLNTGGFIPVYPSTQDLGRIGLDSSGFRRLVHASLAAHGQNLPETLPADVLSSRNLIPLTRAVTEAHFPSDRETLAGALRRLKYEEFFHFQLKLALRRQLVRVEEGYAFSVKSALARQLVESLPFELTRAQVRVIKEISEDMASPHPMNRLLQGDVGSGKTVVALLAMLVAVDNGFQSVFMAPTEILAEQHYKTLSSLLRGLPVTIRLLVGAQKTRLREDVLEDARSGRAGIVVGTHALFEKNVTFHRLGCVVIDEQHRFGVLQRALVRQKGRNPDVLVMTATPIPRTLSLTLYGDLDVSVIDELPKNRKTIKTILRHDDERNAVYQFVREQVRAGRQAYCVFPLIEESAKVDLKAATVHYEHLREKVFPDLRVGLIHGRLPSDEKDRIMGSFKARELDVLVATTVIEVGIDVPNASVMVVEDAERFGLSQLHQLRGRVGRGPDQSYCVLVAKKWIARRAARLVPGEPRPDEEERRLAERRLAAMVATTDGFRIAEIDLGLRGPGDFFGTRQSGMPEFRVASIIADGALLAQAREDAFDLVRRDPHLREPSHQILAEQLHSRFHEDLALLRIG